MTRRDSIDEEYKAALARGRDRAPDTSAAHDYELLPPVEPVEVEWAGKIETIHQAGPFRVLVTGSRLADREYVLHALRAVVGDRTDVLLIHGDANGADFLAQDVALELGWQVRAVPANWDAYGPRAGPIRNQAMVEMGADVCVAFPSPDSRGTWDCVSRANSAGIPVYIVQGGRPVLDKSRTWGDRNRRNWWQETP